MSRAQKHSGKTPMTQLRLQAPQARLQRAAGARAFQCGNTFEVAPMWSIAPRALAVRTGLRLGSCPFPSAWPGLSRDLTPVRMSLLRLPPEIKFVNPGSLSQYIDPTRKLGDYHYFLAYLDTLCAEWRSKPDGTRHPLADGPIIEASSMMGSHRQVYGFLIARMMRTGPEIAKLTHEEYVPPGARFLASVI